jgi:DNA-directed RNA polymerase specialized sigma subunit
LRNLVMTLKKKIRKNRIKVFLFDKPELAKNFAEGKIQLQELERLIRGMYFYDKKNKQEYIKYSTKLGNPYDEVTVEFPSKIQ